MAMDLLDLLDLSQSVIDGVLFGTTYSLIGIGFTLIFGVMHKINLSYACLLYTSPSPRDGLLSRMPSSA